MTEQNTEPIKMWLPEGAAYLKDRSPLDQLKLAIIGPPKGGKSRLAATAPKKPIYYFDFDGRLASLAGIDGVYGKTYAESTNMTKSDAWMEADKDMGMFEMNKLKNMPIPATFVFDSITTLGEAAMRYVVVNDSGVRKELRIGTKTMYTPGGSNTFQAYREETNLIGNFVHRGIELGSDIITIFHERAEEAPTSTIENPRYTGRMSVTPPRMSALLILFNELWRVTPQEYGNQYKVYTKATEKFTGATCLQIEAEEEPDINKMIAKHKSKLNIK